MSQTKDRWQNWTRLESADPVRVAFPTSVAEVSAAVTAAADDGLRVKAVGSGHSFNAIAVADGVQLDLSRLTGVLKADSHTGLVTVAAGTPLWRLAPQLWDLGLSMPNLGDIDRQTLAGAISTGTHGTGTVTPGSVSAQVRGLELVLADGSVVRCSASERPELFESARVGLGAFGVLTAITLQCVPAFHLRSIERPMPWPEAVELLCRTGSATASSTTAEHPEFFWFPHTDTVLWKTNTAAPAGAAPGPQSRVRAFVDGELVQNGLLGVVSAGVARAPRTIRFVNGQTPRFYTRREFVDRSYRVFASSRRVRFREGEFAVPLEALADVLAELRAWFARPGNEIGFPLEVRVGPPEEAWLATAHGRRTAWIAAQTHHRQPHAAYVAETERIVAQYGGRPHWGKLHSSSATRLRELYPRWDDALAVRDKVDPGRLFANAYLDRVLGP